MLKNANLQCMKQVSLVIPGYCHHTYYRHTWKKQQLKELKTIIMVKFFKMKLSHSLQENSWLVSVPAWSLFLFNFLDELVLDFPPIKVCFCLRSLHLGP